MLLQENANNFKTTWFRGQSEFEHSLLPSIFRQGIQFSVAYNEQKMFVEFKRRYPDQSANHKTIYEWLTLMQHYGLPTRLLDWSSNLLVALYFCCSDSQDKDGALFVFDPTYMERDFNFNELMEMQVQEKTRSDFFHRIIYRLTDILNDESLLNGHKIGDIKADQYLRAKFTGLSTGSSEDFISLAVKEDLLNTVDHNGNPLPYIYQDIKRVFSNIIPFKAPYLNPRIT
jgi:hypothetical protein